MVERSSRKESFHFEILNHIYTQWSSIFLKRNYVQNCSVSKKEMEYKSYIFRMMHLSFQNYIFLAFPWFIYLITIFPRYLEKLVRNNSIFAFFILYNCNKLGIKIRKRKEFAKNFNNKNSLKREGSNFDTQKKGIMQEQKRETLQPWKMVTRGPYNKKYSGKKTSARAETLHSHP